MDTNTSTHAFSQFNDKRAFVVSNVACSRKDIYFSMLLRSFQRKKALLFCRSRRELPPLNLRQQNKSGSIQARTDSLRVCTWRPQCLQASNFHFCAASHFGSAVRNQLSSRLEWCERFDPKENTVCWSFSTVDDGKHAQAKFNSHHGTIQRLHRRFENHLNLS